MDALTTERLRIEPLKLTHAQALLEYEIRNRAHLIRWEPLRDDTYYTLARASKQVADHVASAMAGRCARFLAFDDGPDVISAINLWEIQRGVRHAAILGYSVDAAHEGKGYATEAVEAVVRFAFERLNLHRIEASYQPENERSARVLEKLGFAIEGRARGNLYLQGAWRDGILVARVNDAWHPPL